MIAALLLAAASVTATPAPNPCGTSTLTITGPAGTELEFGGDIGDMPPMRLSGAPANVPLGSLPGEIVRWVVEDYRSDTAYASGTFTIPACISAPERPTIVYADEPDMPEIGTSVRVTRTRWAFWNWTLRRWGVAW